MYNIVYRNVDELAEQELKEYSSISIQVMIYVAIGLALGFLFDKIGYSGFISEAVVRAIAGTADTLGLMLVALFVVSVTWLRNHSNWASRRIKNFGNPEAVTWIVGGLIGLGVALLLQALVFRFTDEYGPWGVVHAFAFSNLDNFIAGLTVLVAALVNHGLNDGWTRYWRHPFFMGNAIMLILIPTVCLLVRLFAHFRPETNFLASVEAGLMDVDSVGAAVIFLTATRLLRTKVPELNDSLSEAFRRIFKK